MPSPDAPKFSIPTDRKFLLPTNANPTVIVDPADFAYAECVPAFPAKRSLLARLLSWLGR